MAESGCQCDEEFRSACVGSLVDYVHDGKRYCVLHFPHKNKNLAQFNDVIEEKKLANDFDFGGAFFPAGFTTFEGFDFKRAVNFVEVVFDGNVNFSKAIFREGGNFRGAEFRAERTDFGGAEFRGEKINFVGAQFLSTEQTNFEGAMFFSSELTGFTKTKFFSSRRTSFQGAKFSSVQTTFREAEFRGKQTTFQKAEFLRRGKRTSFPETKFFSTGHTDFSDVEFLSTEHTDFSAKSTFRSERTLFTKAKFSSAETSFSDATFGSKKVLFSEATFKEKVVFLGNDKNAVFASHEQWVWFDHCRIDKPEQLKFNTVLLHPGWFINVDARNFDFTDVAWYGFPGGPEGDLVGEIKALEDRGVQSRHSALSQACQRLSANAEETRDYPLANGFYFWSMDALRKESWSRFKGLTLRSLAKQDTWRDIRQHFGLITTLYWALSGYGVRAARAFWILVGMWAVFAMLYIGWGASDLHLGTYGHSAIYQFHNPSLTLPFLQPNFVAIHMKIGQSRKDVGVALVYSLAALARLRPEPQPSGPGVFQLLVTVEGILGPLQVALLALAIRRQFMR